MIVFNDTLGAYGGSHTLMYRMCKWLSENNIKSAIICTSKDNNEIVDKLENLGVEIICVDMKNVQYGYKVLSYLMEEEDIKVYNLSWNYYLDIECIKKKYKLKFDNFVYCIHPETFKKGIGFKTQLLKKLSIKKYAPIYNRMNKNNALIMMDEIDLDESNKYLNVTLNNTVPIVRLPMYCNEKIDYLNIIQSGFHNDIIMTAARAQFPYKGYIIGLIKDYAELKKTYNNLKLEIISAGEDYNVIVDTIASLDENISKDIVLHGWMDYEKLKNSIEKSKIFVGMGTTVLDSALLYKPSLPVRFNTYENIGDKFIHEKPENITVDYKCNSMAINSIRKILDLNLEEYVEICKESFYSVKNMYDINTCMAKLINFSTEKKDCLLTKKEVAMHILNNKMNMIRYKNVNHFDYNKIEFEKSSK